MLFYRKQRMVWSSKFKYQVGLWPACRMGFAILEIQFSVSASGYLFIKIEFFGLGPNGPQLLSVFVRPARTSLVNC